MHLAAGACYQTTKYPNTALFCELVDGNLSVTPIRFSETPRPAWTLDTSLFPHDADYQGRYNLFAGSVAKGSVTSIAVIQEQTNNKLVTAESSVTIADILPTDSEEVIAVRAALEERLFTAPSSRAVYVEPRIMKHSQIAATQFDSADSVSLDAIAESDQSFLIESRPEYGSSTLCRALHLNMVRLGEHVALRSARSLPNYRKKLELEFSSEINAGRGKFLIILDDYDSERDERLLSELFESGWISRAIVVSVNRRYTENLTVEPSSLPFQPTPLYLWALSRSSIREFASVLLDPNDFISEARAVDKVYSDLLSLKIPLTPSNVVMYLKVLQREGDFEPLSRVDILSKYLSESLRKPSDAASDSFNFKNKMDVLSSFAFYLHSQRTGDFDYRYWSDFCKSYQTRTLREFDDHELLNELVESRVFGTYKGGYFFRYSFYYVFFVGRYLWPRPELLLKFFTSDDYLLTSGVVDVVTGLSSENSGLLTILCERLEARLEEFSTKYVKIGFDPLALARWPSDDKEGEELWKPMQAAISSGPVDVKKIDDLKTSMLAEARTSDQQITFEKFTQLENALFLEEMMIEDALKNSDDVDGKLKTRAWNAILNSVLIVLQVGTMFAPALAKRNRFRWGGISFVDFDKAAEGLDEGSSEALVSVILSLVDAVASKTAHDVGSIKLAAVFRLTADTAPKDSFICLVNFACILSSRGKGWSETLMLVIEKTDKNAYYLRAMLDLLFAALRYEILLAKDREAIKRLVAVIQAKRNWKSQQPGAKAINKMVEHLEGTDYFPEPEDDAKESADTNRK